MNRDFQAATHEEMRAILVFVLTQITGKTPRILNSLRLLEIRVRSPEAKAW